MTVISLLTVISLFFENPLVLRPQMMFIEGEAARYLPRRMKPIGFRPRQISNERG